MGTRDPQSVGVVMTFKAAEDEDLRAAIEGLRDRGKEVWPRVTWESGDAGRMASEVIDRGAEVVIACGGDGTLHEVAGAVLEVSPDKRPAMGGLGYGTGNDFLRGLKDPATEDSEGLEELISRTPTKVDVGRLNDTAFINMATAGAGAEISTGASRGLKSVAGSGAYFFKAIPSAFDLQEVGMHVQAEGLDWEGDVAFAFVGNGPFSGGGWKFCPAADIDDGLLDVLVVPHMKLSEMARFGGELVASETAGDTGPFVYRQVEEVRIDVEEELLWTLDGEPMRCDRCHFRVDARALPFLLPRGASTSGDE